MPQLPPESAPNDTQPTVHKPEDFDGFWGSTRMRLNEVARDYRVGTIVSAPEGASLAPVRFRSLGDAIIQGFLVTQDRDPAGSVSRARPLVITTHGYGSKCNPTLEARHIASGVDLFCFDVRGFGLSQNACEVHPDGYVLTGLTDPDTSILRGAVCDYIRAAEVGMRLHRTPPQRLVFHGRSFGGGLAMMAQAISHYAAFLAVAVPTFGWAAGRRRLVRQGSGREINDYLERFPAHEETVMHTLGYFDTANFAGRIACPTLVGVGQRDDIVPQETVHAIIDRMVPRPEVVELPVSHSTELDEARWEEFDRRWTADARRLS